MRLGQLARKLSLRPNEIVEFLQINNILIGNGSNSRIEDEHALMVIKQFAPDREDILKDEEELEVTVAEPDIVIEPDAGVIEQEVVELPSIEMDKANEEEEKANQNIVQDEPAIIKAQKVELPGLKVIGKIDLPELKKKESQSTTETASTEDDNSSAETPKRNPIEDRRPRREHDRNQKPRKNPIALQREREGLEAEKKRRAEAEREKERRTNNYLKKVRTTQPTKAAKLIKEEVDELHAAEEKAKSWFGRLIHWLTKG